MADLIKVFGETAQVEYEEPPRLLNYGIIVQVELTTGSSVSTVSTAVSAGGLFFCHG